MERKGLIYLSTKLLLAVLFVPRLYANHILHHVFTGVDPDVNRNVSDLITSKGYPVEDHEVVTQDGYILSLQRIPHGLNPADDALQLPKKPVLLMHGFVQNARDWVLNFPDQSLGFLLADAGYDVWLGNMRGNSYSTGHVHLSTKSEKYWDFSFHEIAAYDLPALIDHILSATGVQQLSYIGFSQGTTLILCLLSESPEYNKKVNIAVLLAPVVSIVNANETILRKYTVKYVGDTKVKRAAQGIYALDQANALLLSLKQHLCTGFTAHFCQEMIFKMNGISQQLNETRLPVYISHLPDRTSFANVLELARFFENENLRKRDFGEKQNLKIYGKLTPPEFDLSRITTPLAVYSGAADLLADPIDVQRLIEKLNTDVVVRRKEVANFMHTDFIWGIFANRDVYDDVLYQLGLYSV